MPRKAVAGVRLRRSWGGGTDMGNGWAGVEKCDMS